MRLNVMVCRKMVEVELQQESETVWTVRGTYRGEYIEVSGTGKGPALHAWKEAAAARSV